MRRGEEMKGILLPALSWGIVLFAAACSPTEPGVVQRDCQDVMDQFIMAYNEMDIENYSDCFTDDFVFNVHFDEWYGPSPSYPDSVWYLDTELMYAQALFEASDSVSLEMDVTSIEPFPGDSSRMRISCEFDVKAMLFDLTGYRAMGDAVFTAVEVSDGIWSVSEWTDYSQVKERCTWSRLKWVFYEGTP
jgi:hypothetical protein